MFWWLYHSPQRVDNGTTPWPTVLWLQGGPVSEYIVVLHSWIGLMELSPVSSLQLQSIKS